MFLILYLVPALWVSQLFVHCYIYWLSEICAVEVRTACEPKNAPEMFLPERRSHRLITSVIAVLTESELKLHRAPTLESLFPLNTTIFPSMSHASLHTLRWIFPDIPLAVGRHSQRQGSTMKALLQHQIMAIY